MEGGDPWHFSIPSISELKEGTLTGSILELLTVVWTKSSVPGLGVAPWPNLMTVLIDLSLLLVPGPQAQLGALE